MYSKKKEKEFKLTKEVITLFDKSSCLPSKTKDIHFFLKKKDYSISNRSIEG